MYSGLHEHLSIAMPEITMDVCGVFDFEDAAMQSGERQAGCVKTCIYWFQTLIHNRQKNTCTHTSCKLCKAKAFSYSDLPFDSDI